MNEPLYIAKTLAEFGVVAFFLFGVFSALGVI